MLRARLFGGLVVEIDGRRTPDVPGLKPRTLLAYLLLNPGPHPRSRLAGTFWPEVLDTSARASLRSALWTVRATLERAGGAAYVVGDRSAAGLSAELPRQVDVEEFGRLVAKGDPGSLARAVALADRPLLPELVEEWALDARDAHRDRLRAALEALADAAEAVGDLAGAIGWTRQALGHDRLRESSHRRLMRLLARSGERGGALAAYRRCRDVLAAELGVAPSAETREAMEAIRAGGGEPLDGDGPAPAPASRAAPAAPAPAVVGATPLGELEPAWAAARGGRGGVAAVAAARREAAGVVGELGRQADTEGARHVRAAAGGAGRPLRPFADLLGELARTGPPPPAGAAWPEPLAHLSPGAARAWNRPAAGSPAASGRALRPDAVHARLLAAIVQALAWYAREAPLLLVIEDAERADPASVALVAHLGRALADRPVLCVLAHRPLGPEHALARALDLLQSGGVLRARMELTTPAGADEGPVGAGGLEALRPAARELVELAAAAGRPLSAGDAAALLGAERARRAMVEALAAGLLAPEEGVARLAHEDLAEACLADLTPERRRALHARLAAALSDRPGAPAAEVGRHLRLAGRERPARAFLVAAARDARALGALSEAAGFLRDAAALAPQEPLAAAEVWLALAEVEARRGDREAMDHAFSEARARLVDTGDAQALAGAHAARGRWLRTFMCHPADALVDYRQALDVLALGRVDAPEIRLLAMAGAAWVETVAGDPVRAERMIAEVEAHPEAARDLGLRAELALDRSVALIRSGRLEEAEAMGARAGALGEEAGRPGVAAQAWGGASSAAAARGDFAAALALVERVPVDDVGPYFEVFRHAGRAHALSRLGRHDEAIAAGRAEVAAAERFGVPGEEAVAHFDLGVVLLAAGAHAEAARWLARSLATGSRRFPRAFARLLLAEATLAAGEGDRAREELARFPFEPVGPADAPTALLARLERVEGLVALAEGDLEEALAHLSEAEALWRGGPAGADPGDAYARTLTDLGRPPVAGLVEPALELGRTLADRALALDAAGRREEAGAAAREALEIAGRLAFEGYRARLEPLATARGPAGR